MKKKMRQKFIFSPLRPFSNELVFSSHITIQTNDWLKIYRVSLCDPMVRDYCSIQI
jgi:hypothetical protein